MLDFFEYAVKTAAVILSLSFFIRLKSDTHNPFG